MSSVISGSTYYKVSQNRDTLILSRVCGVYADVCDELERADPDDNALCLILSNFADDIAGFISSFKLLREGRQ